MAITLTSNILANGIVNQLNQQVKNTATGLEQISSGKRINHAKDDAAGLGMLTKLKANNRSLMQATRNANDGISLVQTTEGALNEISNNLVRMRELSIQSASDTLGDSERGFIDIEFQQLLGEIERVSENTEYNGVPLLKGETGIGVYDFHVGAGASESNVIQHDADAINSSISALGISGLSIEEKDSALDGIESLDEAILGVGSMRAQLGGMQSRLSTAANNLENQVLNQDSAISTIEDADVAQVASDFVKHNVLRQSSVAALSQTNMLPSSALKLLA